MHGDTSDALQCDSSENSVESIEVGKIATSTSLFSANSRRICTFRLARSRVLVADVLVSSIASPRPTMSEKTAPSSWGPFLKELARVGMSADLSTLTAPPFILSPTSLIEYTSYWAETPQFLSLIKGTEEERMLAVLEWCLSTFAGQFTAREKATVSP